VDRATYDSVRATLELDRKHPLGLMMHGVTEENGVVQVTQIWESEEYARRYDEERLKPALEAVSAPVEAEITVFQLEDLVTL